MRNRLFVGFLVLVLCAALAGFACAEDLYSFELTEADHIEDYAETWYMDLHIPQISGMQNLAEETELNGYFGEWGEMISEEYQKDTEDMLASFPEDELPHFGYEYGFEPVVDSEDVFVFKTWLYYAAGSSMTVNEYWTLDKHSGELVDILDLADVDRLEEIRGQILDAMKRENETEEIFWTDEADFEVVFSYIEEYHHWYVNENGNLVITFDKYEIAPGVYGESRFEILEDEAVLVKGQKYSFDLYEHESVELQNGTWFLKMRIPEIAGMADMEVETDMNQHFLQVADGIRQELETSVATAEEDLSETAEPLYGYTYDYEVVVDNDDLFVFKTVATFAAGSYMTSSEFWTLDKNTGTLINWEDVVPAGAMEKIHDQIFAAMVDANENDDGLYYTDDESLNYALVNVANYHHWYLNDDGQLVITFDKYEIAVGAQGTSEFVIEL